MNKNKIIITINRPIADVFEFTTNPKNTPLWIPQIDEEVSDRYPPKISTIYKNHGKSGKWNHYAVTEFEKNKLFTLKSEDNNYFVRYTYRKINEKITEMQYFEWVKEGEIAGPYTPDIFQGLKKIMES